MVISTLKGIFRLGNQLKSNCNNEILVSIVKQLNA